MFRLMCNQGAADSLTTHPNQHGCDAFGIEYGSIRRDIEVQVLLMNPTEGPQVGSEPSASPFTGVAVHLTLAIGSIIPRPFVHLMTDGRMGRMAAPIGRPARL